MIPGAGRDIGNSIFSFRFRCYPDWNWLKKQVPINIEKNIILLYVNEEVLELIANLIEA